MTWENQKQNIEIEKPKMETKIEFKNLSEAKQTRGLKVLSYGNFSTGKTHFALSSEKPVYIIDTENGASPLADKFPDAKILNICNMNGDDVEEKDEVKNFENFQQAVDYLCSIPDSEIGTIIIDSISDFWEWCQAYGKIKVFKLSIEDRLKAQFDWGVINKLYKAQINKLINKNCNLILTARETEIYNGLNPSGRYQAKCQKTTPYFVDIVLYHEMKFINKQFQFQAKIDKCRQDGNMVGKIIENPSLEKIQELLKK
jgi:hypothetical protein